MIHRKDILRQDGVSRALHYKDPAEKPLTDDEPERLSPAFVAAAHRRLDHIERAMRTSREMPERHDLYRALGVSPGDPGPYGAMNLDELRHAVALQKRVRERMAIDERMSIASPNQTACRREGRSMIFKVPGGRQ